MEERMLRLALIVLLGASLACGGTDFSGNGGSKKSADAKKDDTGKPKQLSFAY